MKILVTGAGGFVGAHLLRALLSDANNDVYGNVYSATSDITILLPEDHIIRGDLTDFDFTKTMFETVRPDLIYHLASLSVVHDSGAKAAKVLSANISLQYNILESMRLITPSARLISISSANGYGLVDPANIPINENVPFRPLNPYAVSKISQEFLSLQYHLAHKLDIVILRPFNHTGVGQTTDFVIPKLAKQFVQIALEKVEPKLTIGLTGTVRDFTDVKDMVAGYLLAASKCESGQVYNIGSGVGTSVQQIINLLQEISGVKVEIVTDQASVRESDVPVLIADATKFRTITGWSPQIELKETLRKVYNYMKEQNG